MSAIENQSASGQRSLSRREFLSYAWLTSLVALAGIGMRAGLRFLKPRPQPGEFGGIFNVGPAAELPPAHAAPISVPAGRFMLAQTEEGVLALHKVCTHLDCLCDWNDQNHQFVCPCHGSRFAQDGTYLEGPATRSLDRFVVQVKTPTDEVVAETDPVSGAPVPLISPDASQQAAENVGATQTENGEESLGEESLADDSGYVIYVDTGRIILGATPKQQ